MRKVWCVVVDCEAALKAIDSGSGPDLATVLQKICTLRQRLGDCGVQTSFIWTPSRDKKPQWKHPNVHNAKRLRALNAAADSVAEQCMSRRLRGSWRGAWASRVQQAMLWGTQAMEAVSNIASA